MRVDSRWDDLFNERKTISMSKKKKNQVSSKPLSARIYNHRWFYLMFLPVLVFIIVNNYLPMLGLRYAWYNYNGVKDPVFVGWDNFERMFSKAGFWRAFYNTLQLSIIKLILNTFAAVVISILLNEMVNLAFKKFTQTLIYLPHFMSWVVTASVFGLILAPTDQGLVNTILKAIGVVDGTSESPYIYFLGSKTWWRPVYYVINLWKDTGWGTIIFMATLAGISPELYEAAQIDGAGRWQRMKYITLPSLANTIITVLILNLAKVMNLFESVFVLMNDIVVEQSDVLATYIYSQTFNSGTIPNFGYTTAVGLARSVVGCFLVLVCNYASKKTRGKGIV